MFPTKGFLIDHRYEKSSRFMKEGYERDFLRYLQSLLAEVERRIRRGHARLALSQAQQNSGVGGFIHMKNYILLIQHMIRSIEIVKQFMEVKQRLSTCF